MPAQDYIHDQASLRWIQGGRIPLPLGGSLGKEVRLNHLFASHRHPNFQQAKDFQNTAAAKKLLAFQFPAMWIVEFFSSHYPMALKSSYFSSLYTPTIAKEFLALRFPNPKGTARVLTIWRSSDLRNAAIARFWITFTSLTVFPMIAAVSFRLNSSRKRKITTCR